MNEILDLKKLVDCKDARAIAKVMKTFGMTIDKGKIIIPEEKIKEVVAYWDKRQLVKKILLNSALIQAPLVSNNY